MVCRTAFYCPMILLGTLLLSGCGGSSTSQSSTGKSISSTEALTIYSATDDGYYNDEKAPANTFDDDTTEASRWSSDGLDTAITFDLNGTYQVENIAIYWYQGGERTYYFDVSTSLDNSEWTPRLTSQTSSGSSEGFETVELSNSEARYVTITGQGNSIDTENSIVEVIINGYSTEISGADYGLDASVAPSENFDLSDWYLSVPSDTDNSGTADSIYEAALNADYVSEYFYTGSDGAMVFVCPIEGYKTSTNTSYTRTELREMLRSGDTSIGTKSKANNWAFSSIDDDEQSDFGGIDGVLSATLAVNAVTTTGDSNQVGRVIIGQIHGKSNEPARLYYRLLPGNSKGSIYLAHEPVEGYGDEQWYELIGSKSDSADDPSDGIALDEKFAYSIAVVGDLLTVTIYRDNYEDVVQEVDMGSSGYDDSDNYMYFKAGVYNQNKTGDDDDYVQASFYSLTNTHQDNDEN